MQLRVTEAILVPEFPIISIYFINLILLQVLTSTIMNRGSSDVGDNRRPYYLQILMIFAVNMSLPS